VKFAHIAVTAVILAALSALIWSRGHRGAAPMSMAGTPLLAAVICYLAAPVLACPGERRQAPQAS
jgi:hypothetical protein